MMFKKILIANRGAISCRISRTLRKMKISSVALYSDADRESLNVLQSDEQIYLAGNTPQETYLNAELIIERALAAGVDAIHPGYGFLSENADFARKCEAAGLYFLGPTPYQLETCGLKHLCRAIAKEQNIPTLDGSPLITRVEDAVSYAEGIGYPVMIKSSAGGGGIGMKVAQNSEDLIEKFEQVLHLSHANFDDSSVFIEKFISRARHIEVQIFGDGQGNVISLGERDCSTQRRNQKVIEETPAPGLTDDERTRFADAAIALTRSVNYRSAGTVEFLWDDETREFYFLEVNARLQVEHGVTEMVWGVDLVEWMINLAMGVLPHLSSLSLKPHGHAIQTRLYAEDPKKNFQPSIGLINHFKAPEIDRCDTWVRSGVEISPYYDPMLAKLVVYHDTREQALSDLIAALSSTELYGIETNQRFLEAILKSDVFEKGQIHTRFLDQFSFQDNRIEVIDAGIETTIQDYPGRVGMWNVGVPPSGPFDSFHFRIANQILGNSEDAAGIECTVRGATLQFHYKTKICLTGAETNAQINGQNVPFMTALQINEGDQLSIGSVKKSGRRTYLAIEGGIDVPLYLKSRSTFRLGKFGGHAGRALQIGDIFRAFGSIATTENDEFETAIKESFISNQWNIRVLYGPHGAPEFLTEDDIETFFSTKWEVHYNSDRTGVRLIGPKPKWARTDGGEAGLHPSNIHDNAYAVGSIDFTGDMPIILGPDGPSLGGFVCPAVVIKADLWKIGQLSPGDSIQFTRVSNDEAEQRVLRQESLFTENHQYCDAHLDSEQKSDTPILLSTETQNEPTRTYRQSGDGVILIEFGKMILDLDLRFSIQALYEAINRNPFDGLLELVPGIRSLQVQFDPRCICRSEVITYLKAIELPPAEEMEFSSRIVHLPLSWDDPSTVLAIEKYMQIVRKDAPWCPSNIEFIRRINGLKTIEEVKNIVFDASYFVLGLGDVYLGAPVATPLDPRHRLITTKYNPARTWTPENAVGIGGAYMCIYGMEGPGGYQFVGRTLPIWNRYYQTEQFDKPWLLRFFDQIRWYPVSEQELNEIRKDVLVGKHPIKIEDTTFRVKDYHSFLKENAESISKFRDTQQTAFQQERADWERTGAMNFVATEEVDTSKQEDVLLSKNEKPVAAPVIGSLWSIECHIGQQINKGDKVAIIESMKTEFAVYAPCNGVIQSIITKKGDYIKTGQILITIDTQSS